MSPDYQVKAVLMLIKRLLVVLCNSNLNYVNKIFKSQVLFMYMLVGLGGCPMGGGGGGGYLAAMVVICTLRMLYS